ncbi:Cadmium resistance transporter [Metarhizium album ARSEF 1941]|uniref:Cadmium resistance transporter n=1 Tax=Metarhizium album (strain ARSEF 1941) TaxID=1081103 RepID=A0A0B2X0J7_METAS|nr:Cadmium resistance transporter [Metarhizium album ARSEF 1941]KHN99808.1 Cadmium resistance transporter [Metarhizium album ARSEF 1941]
MRFGKAIGTACSSFAITNIDDIFVLVTFMAEASTTKTLTPLKVALGQYLGFTVIVAVSMVGFGVSLVLPSQPIGFLGLFPILLGLWSITGLFFPRQEQDPDDDASRLAGARSVVKVALVTVVNGGDNISTYVPLFSQTRGAEVAVYVLVYYVLVGAWCLVAFLVMRQRHVLAVAEKYARYAVPVLYVGLGIYIAVKSDCYPWTVRRIDARSEGHPGRVVVAVVTTGLLLVCVAGMLWARMRKERRPSVATAEPGAVLDEVPPASARRSTGADAAGDDKGGAAPNVRRQHDAPQAEASAPMEA